MSDSDESLGVQACLRRERPVPMGAIRDGYIMTAVGFTAEVRTLLRFHVGDIPAFAQLTRPSGCE